MRKGGGILIIEVKDWKLESYHLDFRKRWFVNFNNALIKSPISQVLKYKENMYDLHIKNLLELKLRDYRYWYIVNCAIFFYCENDNDIKDFLLTPFEHQKEFLNEKNAQKDDYDKLEEWLNGKPVEWFHKFYAFLYDELGNEENFDELEDFEAIKIFFTHENQEKLMAVRDLILKHHPNAFNHAFSLPICLEFMDKNVDKSHAIAKILEKEPAYKKREEEAAKKGKKIKSYAEVYSSVLMYLTLGMYLLSIQTSIPAIRTRKTAPGCVRSFLGFPFEGEGDDSGINYVACVAFKSRDATTIPWNSLSRLI